MIKEKELRNAFRIITQEIFVKGQYYPYEFLSEKNIKYLENKTDELLRKVKENK